MISVWFKQPESADYPGILLNYLHAQKSPFDDDWKLSWVIDQSLELPHWKHHKVVKLLSGSDGISDKSIRRNLPEVLGLTKGKSSGLFDGSRAQKSCDAILREVG